MNFAEAIRICLSKFFTPYGRASRSEYWWYWLFCLIVSICVALLAVMIASSNPNSYRFANLLIDLLCWTFGISLFIAGIRRMHDIGKSGWNMCWGLIPLIGQIYLIILLCTPGEEESNYYGEPIES